MCTTGPDLNFGPAPPQQKCWSMDFCVEYSSCVYLGVFPLASDADPISGIALTGKIDLFPSRRTQGTESKPAMQRNLNALAVTIAPEDLSDEALIELVRAEDAVALDILFGRHSRLVYGIARRILRDSGEAEEVVQECFLQVFRKAFSYEPARGSAKAWIVQIAYARARDRRLHLMRRGFYLHTEIDSDSLDATLAGRSDMEQTVGARLDLDRLRCAFEDLTEIQRKTLKLFYFEDLDLREISARLDEPLGNVRHHFYRGLERLRKSAMAEGARSQQS
jgi:RNA polymerase sigma-70 factor, ECF subfamily